MKFTNRTSTAVMLAAALCCSGHSLQGMGYFKKMYDNATTWWYSGNPVRNFATLMGSEAGLKLLLFHTTIYGKSYQEEAFDKAFAMQGVQHFQTLIKTESGLNLIRELISQRYNKWGQLFVEPCIKNIQILVQSEIGKGILKNLASNGNSQVSDLFHEHYIENFSTFVQSEACLNIFFDFAIHYRMSYIDRLAKQCADHFKTLMQSTVGLEILHNIVAFSFSGNQVESLFKPCIEHFQMLIKSEKGLDILENIVYRKHSAELTQLLSKACIENFDTLIKSNRGLNIFSILARKYHDTTGGILAKFCVQNFQTLMHDSQGSKILEALANYTKTAQLLAAPCITHFETLMKSEQGLNLLNNMLLVWCEESNNAEVDHLAQLCASHFETLMGKGLIVDSLAKYQKWAGLIVKPYLKNFPRLIQSEHGLRILHYLTSHSDIAQLLVKPCIENFQTLMPSCILRNVAKNANAAQLLVKPCIENFQRLISHDIGLLKALTQNSTAAKSLVKPCLENFQKLMWSNDGLCVLQGLASHSDTAALLVKPCLENFDRLMCTRMEGIRLITTVMRNNEQMNSEVTQWMKKYYDIDIMDNNIPTLVHFFSNFPLEDLKKFSDNNELKGLLKTVLAKEQQFKDDYYTFVHGQRRELYLPEKLYTFLWQLKKKRTLQDFLFAHVKELVEGPEDITYDKIQKNFILSHGNYDSKDKVDARLKLLFMNYALFANSTYRGSCTADYVLDNANSLAGSKINISPSEPFRMFGYQAICDDALKKKIEALAQEYKNASKYGNLLCIAVPKDKIHKYVYLAKTGGAKIDIEIDGIGETSDIRIIMDTLLNAPHKIKNTDQLEFCLIMMQKKGGLDPNTGIKIMPILLGDPKKLEELKKKEDVLLAEIKQKVEQFEMREKAVTRAAILTNQVNAREYTAQSSFDEQRMTQAYERATAILNHLR